MRAKFRNYGCKKDVDKPGILGQSKMKGGRTGGERRGEQWVQEGVRNIKLLFLHEIPQTTFPGRVLEKMASG